jgi:hypothetical protein
LEFNPKDGWGPLCDFLGKNAADTEFPRINDTAARREMLKTGQKWGKVEGAVIICSGLMWKFHKQEHYDLPQYQVGPLCGKTLTTTPQGQRATMGPK